MGEEPKTVTLYGRTYTVEWALTEAQPGGPPPVPRRADTFLRWTHEDAGKARGALRVVSAVEGGPAWRAFGDVLRAYPALNGSGISLSDGKPSESQYTEEEYPPPELLNEAGTSAPLGSGEEDDEQEQPETESEEG